MANDGAERTEKATPRRLKKERDKGNVINSRDLTSALMVTTGVALFGALSTFILGKTKDIMFYAFTHLNPKEISTDDLMGLLAPYMKVTSEMLIPLFIGMFIVGVIVIRMQIGQVLAFEKIKPQLNSLAPNKVMDSLKKLFNPFEPKKMVEFAKSLLKLLVVFACGLNVIKGRLDELYAILGADIQTGFSVISSIMSQMVINMCLAMLVIGIIDRAYQAYEYNKSLKMTKQEVKDEYKDIEGDPKIKAKIRSMGQQFLQQKMMSEVPNADVVVTNPTHYAVALKYEPGVTPAPMVVAKGVDYVAFKIKEIADANNVPVVENRAVARALYDLVAINDIIPSDMFTAVADILAYLHKMGKLKAKVGKG